MKYLLIANWKCNPTTLKETKTLLSSIEREVKNFKNVKVVICPPFLYIPYILNTRYHIHIGAQDVFWEERGAFTGEISPAMLKDFGCEYVIVGHSERRKYFGETDEMINKKIKAALKVKLKPILCIGETEKERKEGKTVRVLKNQLQKDLKGIENWKPRSRANPVQQQVVYGAGSLRKGLKIEDLIVTYEPVWAIGTGQPCGVSEAKSANLFIRKIMKNCLILYGGSVNSENAQKYIKAGFQGLLIGGASLEPKEFIKIVNRLSK